MESFQVQRAARLVITSYSIHYTKLYDSRAELFSHHHVQGETLSVRERMSAVIERLREKPYLEFQQFFTAREGRMGVVVTFLALMELLRERLIDLVQNT